VINHLSIRKGDVLETPSGSLRIVRHVSAAGTPRKTWLYFTIQRCSWTHACYTLYNVGELNGLGWRVVASAADLLNDKFSREIEQDFHKHGPERRFRCCDVRGVA
jgi:hypothetical protein